MGGGGNDENKNVLGKLYHYVINFRHSIIKELYHVLQMNVSHVEKLLPTTVMNVRRCAVRSVMKCSTNTNREENIQLR